MPEDDKMLILPLGEESKIITQAIANDTARKILELLAESPMSTSNIAKRMDIPLTTAQYNLEKLMEAGLVVVEKTKYSEKGREVKLYAPAKRMIVLVPKTGSSQSLIDTLKKYLVLLPVAALASLFVEIAMRLRGATDSLEEPLLSGGASLSTYRAVSDGTNETFAMSAANDTSTYFNGAALPVSAPVPETLLGAGNVNLGAGNATAVPKAGQISGHIAENASEAWQATAAPDTGIATLIPPDLLNHWGLWFLAGCLLIISLMVAYDLYCRRKAKKK